MRNRKTFSIAHRRMFWVIKKLVEEHRIIFGAAMKTLKRFVQAYNVFIFPFFLCYKHRECVCVRNFRCGWCVHEAKGAKTCRLDSGDYFTSEYFFSYLYSIYCFVHSAFFLVDFRSSYDYILVWRVKHAIIAQTFYISDAYHRSYTLRVALLLLIIETLYVLGISRGSTLLCITTNYNEMKIKRKEKTAITLSISMLLLH